MSKSERMEIVDAHVHWWDLSAHAWYPLLQPEPSGAEEGHDFGLGEMTGLARNYLPEDYRNDSAGVDVTKVVHVSAVSAPRRYLDETRWLDGLGEATGWPTALIGAIEPTEPADVIIADLDAQAQSPRFRGARVLIGLDPESSQAGELLRWLSAGGWVFDLVAHPGEMDGFARLVAAFPSLPVVLEHSGWPDTDDNDHFAFWRRSMARLAALDNVACKVSGLPMTLHSMEPSKLRPWVDACLETFGVGRCMFGSNFPVDSLFGTYEALLSAYRAVTEGLSDDERTLFFVGTAERIYRI